MYIALDLETTGLDFEKEDIIELGAIVFDQKGKILEEINTLIKTDKEIPELISQITGIKNTDMKDAVDFNSIKENLQKLLNENILVGHNINFDINFLEKYGIQISNDYFDTLFLSSAILLEEKSYSLETLCQTLNLKNLASHNAYEDAKSSMKLFLYLIPLFEDLNQKVIDEIKIISKKADLPIKSFFEYLNQKKINKKQKKTKRIKTKESNEEYETGYIYETNENYSNVLNKLIKNEQFLISVSKELFSKTNEINEEIKKLDNFTNYINDKRLNEQLSKTTIKDYEARALIKAIIYLSIKQDFPLTDLKLFNEEKKIISKINYQEKNEKLKYQDIAKIICTHDYLIENPNTQKETYILDLNTFEKALNKTHSKYISLDICISPLESLKEKSTDTNDIEILIHKTIIFFGLCGIFLENHKQKTSDFLDLEEKHINSSDWTKISDTLKGMISLSKNLIKYQNENTASELQNWKKNLIILSEISHIHDIQNQMIVFNKLKDQSTGIRIEKKDLSFEKEEIFKKINKISIIDNTISLNDNAKFFISYYKLANELKYLNLKTKNDYPDLTFLATKDKNKYKAIIDICSNTEENIVIIENSRTIMKKLTIDLAKDLKSKLILSETLASIGKINEKINSIKSNNILIISPNNFEKLDSKEKFKNIIINRIPFVFQKNKNANFLQETLPLSILRMKRLLQNPENKTNSFILDERVLNTNYSKKIIEMLKDSFNIIS